MKRLEIVLLLVLGISVILASCQKAPSLNVTGATSFELNALGGETELSFTANQDWSVSNSVAWISVYPNSGTGSKEMVTITIKCSKYKEYSNPREGTITIMLKDAPDYAETIRVRQTGMEKPREVDLDIVLTRDNGSKYKLLWADRNIGAFYPEDSGDLFAWGETKTRVFPNTSTELWISYKLGNSDPSNWQFMKYCLAKDKSLWGGSGNPDNKVVLDLEEDAANAILGNGWRMPTYEEWLALTKMASFSDQNSSTDKVQGRWVLSRQNSNNKVFLPYVVSEQDTWLYWSSSLSKDYLSTHATAIGMKNSWWITGYYVYRYYGLPIRPVKESAL